MEVLNSGKQMHEQLSDTELIMSQLHKMLESHPNKQMCEIRSKIEVSIAGLSANKNKIGKILIKLGMLPPKAKSSKRAISPLIK